MNLTLRASRRRKARGGLITPTRARYFLSAVRLVNGAAATFTPEAFSKRMGVDTSKDPSVVYPLRLFGIRTLLIGGDLLLSRGDRLQQAIFVSPAIHAADAGAAIFAGVKGQLPRKTATTGAVISLVNLALAVRMVLGARQGEPVES